MNLYEVEGYYGSGNSQTTIFVAENRYGSCWYVCQDSCNVNCTYDAIEDGCYVEELEDVDCFTWNDGIGSLEELEYAINF